MWWLVFPLMLAGCGSGFGNCGGPSDCGGNACCYTYVLATHYEAVDCYQAQQACYSVGTDTGGRRVCKGEADCMTAGAPDIHCCPIKSMIGNHSLSVCLPSCS
jgi:hypothetical protein